MQIPGVSIGSLDTSAGCLKIGLHDLGPRQFQKAKPLGHDSGRKRNRTMGKKLEAETAAFQERACLEPLTGKDREAYEGLSDLMYEFIKVIQLHISGIRDGHGYWSGSDVVGHYLGKISKQCQELGGGVPSSIRRSVDFGSPVLVDDEIPWDVPVSAEELEIEETVKRHQKTLETILVYLRQTHRNLKEAGLPVPTEDVEHL